MDRESLNDAVETKRSSPHGERPARVVIQQPALPKYRVPVYRALAQRPGISLRVVHAVLPDLTNVSPDGFDAQLVRMRRFPIGRHVMMWHTPQIACASRKSADVLILSWDLHYLTLIPALVKAKLSGVPVILWGHGYSKAEASWRSYLRRTVAELASALLFYNHTTAKQFTRSFGWDPARVFVAPNAIDQDPIQAARQAWLSRPEELAAFRAERGLLPGPVILFVSRLDPANRVDLLLHAAARLVGEYPELRVAVIGKGQDEPRLRQMASELGMGGRVLFAGPVYEEMRLAPWFLSSDVFCYPHNIGLSILHALGYGLPVVTSNQFGSQNPEIEALEPNRNGLTFEHGSVDSLALALRELLRDPARRAALAAEAHRTVTEKFTLANMVNGFVSAIRYCAGSGRRDESMR